VIAIQIWSDGIVRGAVNGLDAQVLLDPFEEGFHQPAATVQLRHLPGAQAQGAVEFKLCAAYRARNCLLERWLRSTARQRAGQ
jgi:hypothetical protein